MFYQVYYEIGTESRFLYRSESYQDAYRVAIGRLLLMEAEGESVVAIDVISGDPGLSHAEHLRRFSSLGDGVICDANTGQVILDLADVVDDTMTQQQREVEARRYDIEIRQQRRGLVASS